MPVSVEERLVGALLIVGFLGAPLKLLDFGWPAYLLPDGLAVLTLLVVVQRRVNRGLRLVEPGNLTTPVLLLSACCLLELANPHAPLIRSVLGLRSWLLYLSFYFVGLYSFTSIRQLQRLYGLLLMLGVTTAIYGVHQWYAGPAAFIDWSPYYARYTRLFWDTSEGTHVFRAFSTYVAPGVFGGNMALLIVIALGMAASGNVSGSLRLVLVVAMGAMAAGIAVAGSRAPVVHLVIALAFVPLLFPRVRAKIGKTITLLLIAAVAAAFVLMSPVAPAVAQRFGTLLEPMQFLDVWTARILGAIGRGVADPLGMGLGYTGGIPSFLKDPMFSNLPSTSIDSGYGSAAVELGIFGLIFFVYFTLKVAIEGVHAWRKLPAGRLKDFLVGPALLAASYPVWAVVAQPHATLPTSIYFWLLLGMLVKAPTLREPDACESHSRSPDARPRTATAGTSSSWQRGWRPRSRWRSGPARSRLG